MTRGPRRDPSSARHLRRWTPLVLVALFATACGLGGDQPLSALRPEGPVAEAQDDLWNTVFPIAVVVFVLVNAALLYSLVRFRARGDETAPPRQVHGNTKLEVLWTIIPAAILAAIAIPTVATIFNLSGPPAQDALEVQVVGKQYWWEFEYLNADATTAEGANVVTSSELHIPAGREVFLYLNGRDDNGDQAPAEGVLHSFWVPRLAGKQDYVPGNVKTMRIEADEPGEWLGECAEFCGLSHANMKFNVIAHPEDEFQTWIAQQAEPADTGGAVAQGEELFEELTCINCHAVAGHPADTDIRIGPNLTHFAQRQRFAGYIVENNAENLAEWLADPQEVKPGAQMPALGLSPEEIDALVAYLQSLD